MQFITNYSGTQNYKQNGMSIILSEKTKPINSEIYV